MGKILAAPEPPEDFKYSQGIRHYVRGIAFASKGDMEAARKEQQALVPLKDTVSIQFLDERDYPASLLLDIADQLLLGEIQFAKEDYAGASAHYVNAVNMQDTLPYTEPPFWYYPSRQSLGHALLMEGKAVDAEKVYRKDLEIFPRNGWSMFGLVQALEAQNKSEQAGEVQRQLDEVWQMSDIKLTASRI